jgi:LmbE family N-acetylglucosaminyl deacetylase
MSEPKPKQMLVILAHPDDESFTAGGTLAKYARQAVQVVLLCATRGEAGIAGVKPEAAGKIREGELRKAAEQLGIEVHFLGCHDGELSHCRMEMLAESMAWWMDLIQPQVIITFGPEGVSGHPDHVMISNAVTHAYDKYYKKGILLYIRPSKATLSGCGVSAASSGTELPSVKVDISEYRLEKVRAVQCHASQNPGVPGKPEAEAEKMPCHEMFTLARDTRTPEDTPSWFEREEIRKGSGE